MLDPQGTRERVRLRGRPASHATLRPASAKPSVHGAHGGKASRRDRWAEARARDRREERESARALDPPGGPPATPPAIYRMSKYLRDARRRMNPKTFLSVA